MNVLRWQRLSVLWRNWMFNQEPQAEVQRVDLQDEEGEVGRGGGTKEEVKGRRAEEAEGREGGGSQKEAGGGREEKGGGRRRGGGEEVEGEREERGGDEEAGGRRGRKDGGEREGGGERGGGGGTEALDSAGVDFERKVQACARDLGPEGEDRRTSGSCWSEEAVVSLLQVDNSSSESDEAVLQREESQRRSRRRFRRINPQGEREVITTDGQEDCGLTTVGALPVS